MTEDDFDPDLDSYLSWELAIECGRQKLREERAPVNQPEPA